MPRRKTSAPTFFQIQATSGGSTGEFSYDHQSKTVKIQGIYRPQKPRYLDDVPAAIILDSDSLSERLRKIRPRPKEIVKPTQQEWSLLSRIADCVCIWGIRGTDSYVFDWLVSTGGGSGYRVDIEIGEHILQTPITRGEHDVQWRLFDAACRTLVGESRLEILSNQIEPIWNSEYSAAAYLELRNSPQATEATTVEILEELLALWEKAVTPAGGSLPETISDWESTALYWESLEDGRRAQLCRDVLASLMVDYQRIEQNQVRPWWEGFQWFGDGPPCPACGRPVRTTKSEQCFSCGADWHGRDPYQLSVPILNGGWQAWLFLSFLMSSFIFMAIAFAEQPFNTTQYVFMAILACVVVACMVKGLWFCARRIELSRDNLKLNYPFRTTIIDWSTIKSALFVDNRARPRFLGSIFDGQIPVPVCGMVPNISYYELVLRFENSREIRLPLSPEMKGDISKTIGSLASLDPTSELVRSSREKENERIESRLLAYYLFAVCFIGGLIMVGASITRAINIKAWPDSLSGLAFGLFLAGVGAFFVRKELDVFKRMRRRRPSENARRSEGHSEDSNSELSWAERIRGSQ